MIELGEIAPSDYSFAAAARAFAVRQTKLARAAVYDDGILSPRKRRRIKLGMHFPPWTRPGFVEFDRCELFFSSLSRARPAAITAAVAAAFGIPRDDLFGPSHKRPCVYARHAATWLLRRYWGGTLGIVGRVTGRHHTTVLHSLARCAQLCACDDDFARRTARVIAWLQPCETEQHPGGA